MPKVIDVSVVMIPVREGEMKDLERWYVVKETEDKTICVRLQILLYNEEDCTCKVWEPLRKHYRSIKDLLEQILERLKID